MSHHRPSNSYSSPGYGAPPPHGQAPVGGYQGQYGANPPPITATYGSTSPGYGQPPHQTTSHGSAYPPQNQGYPPPGGAHHPPPHSPTYGNQSTGGLGLSGHHQSISRPQTHTPHSPPSGYGAPPHHGQSGGFYGGAPPPGPAPPGADPQLWGFFNNVDLDRSGAISVRELQQALKNGDWSAFDLDTVQMLMNVFDTDRTGTISFHEFGGLWKYILDWQGVFRHFDADRSGTIERHELANALRQFGYNLGPHLLELIEHKFAGVGASGPGYPPPGITFDRFVRACVLVKTMTEAFQRTDTDRDGWIRIDYNTFMSLILSAP